MALLAAVAMLSSGVPAGSQPAPPEGHEHALLTPGSPVVRLSTGEETHRYTLNLGEGEYLRVVAEQLGVDLALRLIDPTGAVIAEADGTGGRWLEENLAAITPASGRYELRVVIGKAEPESRYRLELVEHRDARPDDTLRVEAEQALQWAQHLARAPTEAEKREALEILEEASNMWEQLGDGEGMGRVLHARGALLFALGEWPAANGVLQEGLAFRRSAGDRAGVAETLDLLGAVQRRLGDIDAARASLEEALAVAKEAGVREIEAWALTGLAGLDLAAGATDSVIERYEQAIEIVKEVGRKDIEIDILASLGRAHRLLGNSTAALEVYESGYEQAQLMGDYAMQSRILNSIGIVHRSRGELRKALAIYERARLLSRQAGIRGTERAATTNIGVLYGLLGSRERALEALSRALALAIELGSPKAKARVALNLAWNYQLGEEWEAAKKYLEEALHSSREAEDLASEVQTLVALGRIRRLQGDVQGAIPLLTRATELTVASMDIEGEHRSRLELGTNYFVQGKPDQAVEHLGRALEITQVLEDPGWEAATRMQIAHLAKQKGDFNAAIEQAEQAISMSEMLRREVASPVLRSTYLARIQDDYHFVAEAEVERAEQERNSDHLKWAFKTSERARARTLLDLLAEIRQKGRPAERPSDLLDERANATAELSRLQRVLVRVLARAETNANNVDVLRQKLRESRHTLERLEWEIRAQDPLYSGERSPQPLDLAEIQATLSSSAALLSYFLGEERSFLFVVTSEDLRVKEIAAEKTLAEPLGEVLSALRQPGRRSQGRFETASARLYELLIAPVQDLLKETDTLLIVPDGGLVYLPFEALIVPGGEAGPGGRKRYLLDHWAVGYAPSASVYAKLQRLREGETEAADRKRWVAFADPVLPGTQEILADAEPVTRGVLEDTKWAWRRLPGARREVEGIAEMFPVGERTIYLGAEATEARVKEDERVSQARVLHLASHALIDEESPTQSAVLLAQGEHDQEDGLLQMREIFDLQLSADLVVLSACESGLGKAIRGEGLLGLTQAFFHAGARSLLVSLWPVVDQASAELMVAFYREMLSGASTLEALRSAKLSLLEQPRTAHPYYWSPFVLVAPQAETKKEAEHVTNAGVASPVLSDRLNRIDGSESEFRGEL